MVKAYKSSQEFAAKKGTLFDKVVKCLLSCIWKEHPKWDLMFVKPEVVPDLIVDFTRDEQEDAKMIAQMLRTQGASSSK